ncbi:hypothetical protein C2G38_2040176 [Gigaspora rosea]|uniref:Galactose oxidase n=1 Tax=Gigaspora rosea TaxID=44941 RepID=A0A397UWG7_9GLOM|nr:hypothetical protein C2G38_2040176 [Gigaspora rosea]
MNPFRALFSSLIVISLTFTNVTCFRPDPRVGQASILVGSNLYFFGGNTYNPRIFTKPNGDKLSYYYNDSNIFDTKTMRWSTLTLTNTPLSRVSYSAVLKGNLIFYIGGDSDSGSTFNINEILVFDTVNLKWLFKTTRGDPIGSRSRHSAVLTQGGLILIYGGAGPNGTQVQPDLATLDVSVTPYTWKVIIIDNAPPPLMYHSATLHGIYMIIAFGNYNALN